jgi:hypothetical protein
MDFLLTVDFHLIFWVLDAPFALINQELGHYEYENTIDPFDIKTYLNRMDGS